MKPATAYAVAAAALDWEDRRADRADAKRARADAIRAFCEEHGADSHDDDCLEATKAEHAAYMKAVKAEKSARQRMRAQVARARAEIAAGMS